MASLHRANDAVITVCQNNDQRSIDIKELNDPARRLLGLQGNELIGATLSHILPARIVEAVNDYLEFDNDANDLSAVLGKIRDFRIRTRAGDEIPFKLKVLRSEAIDRNQWFKLILQDEAGLREAEAVQNILKDNFKGHEVLDKSTGLPDKASLKKDLDLVLHHINSNRVQASFAVLEIDHYETLLAKHGREVCNRILTEIAGACRQKLRGDDTLGSLWYNELGIILMDTPLEAARMVLNRLRWHISSHPLKAGGEEVTVTVSIAFREIRAGLGDIVASCETVLETGRGEGGNKVVEVV